MVGLQSTQTIPTLAQGFYEKQCRDASNLLFPY